MIVIIIIIIETIFLTMWGWTMFDHNYVSNGFILNLMVNIINPMNSIIP